MLSLGAIIYFLIRSLPRIDDTILRNRKSFIKSHIIFYYVEKIDIRLKYFSEKTLRRISLVLLKLENKVNKKLSKMRKENLPKESFIIPDENKDSSDLSS